ncbi:MAG: FecR domain-containing protein [Agriterribacter sp.]
MKDAVEDHQLFVTLFNKYLDNRCSPEEAADLFRLIQSNAHDELVIDMIENRLKKNPGVDDKDTTLIERLDERLTAILTESPGRTMLPRRRLYLWRWVAAASVLLIVFISLYRFEFKTNTVAGTATAHDNIVPVAAPLAGYTRFISLPDGSSVVLHAGAQLEFPTFFAGKTREVRLTGEAFFDVYHNPEKPFIIHTGAVKTTVLGTAFNIKSDGARVVVSVTRGKVKVEDASKIVAVLTPDQQVEYDVSAATVARHTVHAETLVTAWTKENMVFDGISFEEIGTILSRRYGVPVQFENEALKKCKIRASFSGTEALDQVASVLSAIRNGSFAQLTDGTIVFKGEGCN